MTFTDRVLSVIVAAGPKGLTVAQVKRRSNMGDLAELVLDGLRMDGKIGQVHDRVFPLVTSR